MAKSARARSARTVPNSLSKSAEFCQDSHKWMAVEKPLDHASMGEVVVNCSELLDHVLQVPKFLAKFTKDFPPARIPP